MTPHGFMLEAIAEKAEQSARRDEFSSDAEARYINIVETGKTISWAEMRAYLQNKSAVGKPRRAPSKKSAR